MRGQALRLSLWVTLAALGSVGVAATHALHLVLGTRITSRALALKQARLGQRIAQLVADQASDALLTGDVVTLNDLATSTTMGSGVSYCVILREGHVLATSSDGLEPQRLLPARHGGDREPLVLIDGSRRVLDLAQPILGGLGEVRLGLDMGHLASTQREIAVQLGLLALGVIAVGLLAAFTIGRGIARPLRDILHSADRFDPSKPGEVPTVVPSGTREIARLGESFNQMLLRLRASHEAQEQARMKSLETERLAALGSFVAGITHEVNNPLAGLKNCVYRLSRPDLSRPKRDQYLALMEEGLTRIEDVVKGLLDFGRPHPVQFQPLTLGQLAREAMNLVQPQLKHQGISCSVAGDEGAVVLADRHRVGQALVNLLLNAAYVTPKGQAIGLRLCTRGELRGIAVEDPGPGIPPEIRDRILEPFFTTKPSGEGTGLGLSVTRTIADAHGGELTFEFPTSGGTIATLWLRAPGVQLPASPRL